MSAPSPAETALPLRSWSRIRNHGDGVSADIVRLLFNREPMEVAADVPHVLAVGSITFMANRQSTLWGCGVLNRQVGLQPLAPDQIRALRGRHSADVMTERGIRLPDLPLGDPGMFAADLLRVSGLEPRRRAGVVVVPHHGSLRHPAYAAWARAENVAVVDTLNNDWGLLQDIAGADVVVSESLRGLVYAESLGKPSLWISRTEDPNWVFKFHDWFSTTLNGQSHPASLDEDIAALAARAEFRYSTVSKPDLLASFPHERATPLPSRLVPYDRCRDLSPMMVFGDDSLAAPLRALAGGGADAPAAFDRIRERVAAIFDGWAERPYVCVVDRAHAAIPDETQRQVIALELDRRVDVDFGVVTSAARLAADGGGESVELGGAVRFYPHARTLDLCLMLRPSLDGYGAHHAAFAI